MATYNLKDDIDRMLRKLADQQHRSPEEVLGELVEQKYAVSDLSLNETDNVNPLLKMAENAERLGLSSGRSDISENMRDILREEFPEYLRERMDRDETDSN